MQEAAEDTKFDLKKFSWHTGIFIAKLLCGNLDLDDKFADHLRSSLQQTKLKSPSNNTIRFLRNFDVSTKRLLLRYLCGEFSSLREMMDSLEELKIDLIFSIDVGLGELAKIGEAQSLENQVTDRYAMNILRKFSRLLCSKLIEEKEKGRAKELKKWILLNQN